MADLPPPPPATAPDAQPSVQTKRRLPLWAAIPFILLAGVVGIVLLRGGDDSMPASIDGVPRLTTPQARSGFDAMEKAMESLGAKAEMEAYGYGSTPSFLVVVFEEPTGVGFDQEFRAFSYSFMGTSGTNLDPKSVVDETYRGVHYRCQSDDESGASVCVMGEGRRYTALAIVDSSGSDSALTLAKKVQAATGDVTP